MKLESHAEYPTDLREHWVNLQKVAGPGKIADNIMYREGHQRERMKHVVNMTNTIPGMHYKCVELGCCEGAMTELLSLYWPIVLAVDFVPELLAQCPPLKNVTYECRDVERWNPGLTCDVVVMSEILEHVRNPKDIVQAWAGKARYIVASCPTNEELNNHTFDAYEAERLMQGHQVSVGGAAGHIWAMDNEGFSSLFEGLEILAYEMEGPGAIIVAKGTRNEA